MTAYPEGRLAKLYLLLRYLIFRYLRVKYVHEEK